MSLPTDQKPAQDYGEPWRFDADYGIAVTRNESVGSEERVVECVNACAGMTDPVAEIQAMRLQIEQALRAAETKRCCETAPP